MKRSLVLIAVCHWLCQCCVAVTPARSADGTASEVVLAVHGGAGVVSKELSDKKVEQQYRDALTAALRAGYAELQKPSATSLDAVVATIKPLEDSPLFNAGKGAAFTRNGRNEMDASIMEGKDRRAGAVASVTTIKNPIVAARIVMQRTPHVLMVGSGAEELAGRHGAEIVDPSYFRTELRWRMLQEKLEKEKLDKEKSRSQGGRRKPAAERFGTVGCVAVDRQGNLAAGTSTGGLTGKLSGRVGDSPIIGAGTFADNASCAVSATGDGEYFIRASAAHDIAALVEYKGLSLAEASRRVIHEKIKPAGGEGGVIVLDAKGNLAMTYSNEGMYRGYVTRSGEIKVMIFAD